MGLKSNKNQRVIEIKLMEGLGNQMFIYAFARSLQLQGYDILLDVSFYHQQTLDRDSESQNPPIRKLEILDFDIKLPIINHPKQNGENLKIFGRFKKIIKKIYFEINKNRFYFSDEFKNLGIIHKKLKKKFLGHKYLYFSGYFQNLAFFENYSRVICDDFILKKPLSPKNLLFKKKIQDIHNSCFLHVRRGDYLLKKNHMFVRLNIDYYQKAIQVLLEKIEKVHIFVFSNDTQYCRTVLIPELKKIFKDLVVFTLLDHNDEGNAIEEMELMRSCCHGIIANSTFSWWSAYLIDNPQKIIVSPSHFLNNDDVTSRLIPQDHHWTIVDV